MAIANQKQFMYPPSTGTLVPLIKAAYFDARNPARYAVSDGSANLFIGILSFIFFDNSLYVMP